MFKKYVFCILLITSLALSACGEVTTKTAEAPPVQPTDTTAVQPTEAVAAQPTEATSPYTESPILAELVKSGKLPPIQERLPEEPFVVGPGVYMTEEELPDWQTGKYGGTLTAAHYGTFGPDMFVAMNEPLLHAPKIGVQNIVGNVVRDFKVENDNKDFTFFMRKGLKWSDGELVTTEDVRFVWEDIYLNEKLTPVFPARFRNGFKADGEPGKLQIIDDYTFKISFTNPYGGFLRNLTIEGWVGYTELIQPSHLLKKKDK